MSASIHSLVIKQIIQETDQAVSLVFEIPNDLKEAYQFQQGQYITLIFQLRGQEVRRAYSMCSSPSEPDLKVTVKRLKGGLVSNYIHDQLKVGMEVSVMNPQGRFFVPIDPAQARTYYLIGGGSGITPLMSILKTVLSKEAQSQVYLFYGNLNEKEIIFYEELNALQREYNGRFVCEHILEKPIVDKPKGLGGLFRKGQISWQGLVGRPDAQAIHQFVDRHPSTGQAEYFICGPEAMMQEAEQSLKARGVNTDHIHLERFHSDLIQAPPKNKTNQSPKGAVPAIVHLHGEPIELDIPAGKTILDALEHAGFRPPYSCTAGVCATCMAKVTKGRVEMDQSFALSDKEIEEGYILTCQAHPTSDEIELIYE